jgi:tetratricopeptide (TPR) repeat protein
VSEFLIGTLSILLATNKPAALTNLAIQRPGLVGVIAAAAASSNEPEPTDPVERELRLIMKADNAAQEEADDWIQAAEKEGKDAELLKLTLKGRLEQRFKPIREQYETFIQKNPKHSGAHLAYGSFLGDTGDEEQQVLHYEKARELDPTNPACWNNLANIYGHHGPIEKAFEYYEKAVQLNPLEPVYWHNFATTVFLFRKDAAARWKIDEQGVFRKAMDLYGKARELKPHDFVLASDIAETYYGIKPLATSDGLSQFQSEKQLVAEAMQSWSNALQLADGPVERQGVLTHLARWHVRAGRYDEARGMLDEVTNSVYQVLRKRIERSITNKLEKVATPVPEK